jgi:hypothetical protein
MRVHDQRDAHALSAGNAMRKLVTGLAALMIAATFGVYLAMTQLETYRTFPSPDGAYRIEVLRRPSPIPGMPGQGSDASGEVRLVDRNGRLIQKEPLELVQLVDAVEWSADEVRVGALGHWKLRAAK